MSKEGIFVIEKYFKQETTLESVMKYCAPHFAKIDKYGAYLRQKPDDITRLNKIMILTVGEQAFLEPILGLAITYKKNGEEIYYNKRRIEIEKEGTKKFSSAPTEREASAHVANYRRVRNIIQAYVDTCKAMISAIQSRLKNVNSTSV